MAAALAAAAAEKASCASTLLRQACLLSGPPPKDPRLFASNSCSSKHHMRRVRARLTTPEKQDTDSGMGLSTKCGLPLPVLAVHKDAAKVQVTYQLHENSLLLH